jgi:hypothetical protein
MEINMETKDITPDSPEQKILSPGRFLKTITLIIIGFSIYSCASLNSTNYEARKRAVNKITDQNILYKVAIEDLNFEVKIAAFNRITDPNLISKIAIESKEPILRLEAVNKITDQRILYEVALEDMSYEVKIAALNWITDPNLINRLAFESKDPNIRLEAVNKITDQNILYKAALEDKYDIKIAAMNRLNPSLLAKLASDFKEINLKLKVVEVLTDQIELMNISQNNDNWDVRKAAFKKLDVTSLDILTSEAKDPAITLSAKIRLGRVSWNEAFSGKSNSTLTLGDVIGAAAIVDIPQPTSFDVVSACHKFIQLGDASRIPELIFLLNKYGNVSLAEDYMNCGESTLEDAGCKWGRAHGYTCTTGNGSNRVRWGSKR